MRVSITKRTATKADTDLAREIHHEAYHDVVLRQFGSWDEKLQDDFFNDDWEPSAHDIILADNEICGYTRIRREPDHIFLDELVFLPKFQGKGIGTSILKELIEESRRKKLPIRLGVFKENRAQELYRKLGFKNVGTTDTQFKMEWKTA